MKRLNVKLTLWLVGLAVFSIVGVHFLHGYQIDRNADFLRVQAEKAREAGNAREAMKQYNQYLKHRDDPQGYSALAEVVIEIAKDADATIQDKRRAYSLLEEAIRRHPDLDDVRRSLIDYTMQARRFGDALEHIERLVENGAKDADLDLKVALCHYQNGDEEKSLKQLSKLLSYDDQSGTFAAERPTGADQVSAFELLAQIMRGKADGANRAGAVMAQLVTWNEESAKAHLARAGYLIGAGEFNMTSQEFQDAKPELDRAIELAPDDVDVIVTMAVYEMSLGVYAMSLKKEDESQAHYARAQELLDKALAAHPERQDIYLRLSQLSLTQRDVKKAVKQLTEGLAKATDVNLILERLVDLQFQLKDLDAVRALCKQMRDRGTVGAELIRYQEARLKFAEESFLEASRELEAVRPILARFNRAAYVQQLDLLLGRCYEYLNQPDKQLEVYRRILDAMPSQAGARLGEAQALQALGRHAEAAISVKLLADNVQNLPFLQSSVMYLLINDELQKPEDKRDWTKVDSIAQMMFSDPSRSELDNTLLKSELLMLKNDYDEAQKLLLAAQKDHPKDSRVWMTLTKLMSRNEKTRSRLPQLLDRVERELGHTAALRAERIKVVAQEGGDQAAAKLKQLEQGLDSFSEPERISLILSLGNAYLQIRQFADAKRWWTLASTKDPKNANIRQYLFDLAVDTKDEAGASAVVKELEGSRYFGTQSPLYKYCAATQMLWRLTLRHEGKKSALTAEDRNEMAQARKLIDGAIASRSEWGVLWRVRAEIDQLEGNLDGAVTNYQRSLEFSRTGQAATARRLVQLLYATNRLEEANEALQFLGEVGPNDPLRRMVGDIKEKNNQIDDALAMAEKDVVAKPDDTDNRVWYGQLLVRAGRTEDAEKEFRKAVELSPKVPGVWELLVRHLVAAKRKSEAVEVIRGAAKSLDDNAMAMARLYERVDDQEQAENHYKLALEKQPDDTATKRQIVEYYRGSNQTAKAVPYLEQIIEKTANATNQAELAQLAWARRAKAEVLAVGGEYRQVMEAVALVEANAKTPGRPSPEDSVAMISLLSRRPERQSRDKAVRLLEELQKTRPLSAREQTVLAQLYSSSGNWAEARDLMLAALSRRDDDPEIVINLASLLINHEEYDDAGRWVERAEELIKPPAQVAESVKQQTRLTRARLLAHHGQKEQAIQALESLVPGPLPQSQLYRLESVAKMMESLKLYDGAERLLNDYVAQEPRGAIAMAAYLGRRGDIDRAFALLEESRKNQLMIEILPCALEALRLNREKATPERFRMLEEWSKSGLTSEANPQQIKLLHAEMLDLQGRYPEVIQMYRDVLADKDASHFQQALVKNNLAFILAITKKSPADVAEAMKLTEESIAVMGPTTDLLDTRALAFMAQGKAGEAVADLKNAIADDPSITKYFHLAMAEKQAGNRDAARVAMAKAEELGANPNLFTALEKATYEQLVKELK